MSKPSSRGKPLATPPSEETIERNERKAQRPRTAPKRKLVPTPPAAPNEHAGPKLNPGKGNGKDK